MFITDQPILLGEQDSLNRIAFAKQIAAGIKSWDAPNSGLVVAIYGAWGSGKTSIKNLTAECLTTADQHVELINFNPWLLKNQEELARQLLTLIGKKISILDPDTQKRTAKLWGNWSKSLSMLSKASSGVGSILNLISSTPVGEFAKIFGKNAESVSSICTSIEEAYEASAALDDIESIREILYSEMKKLQKPVLILMDDIDRLTGDEIRTLFQVIKTHCDFPNLGFLLMCQQETIESSLAKWIPTSEISAHTGRHFLEKIVNVGLNVPPLRNEYAKSLLETTLRSCLTENVFEKHETTLEIIISLISETFETPRKIKRFGSAISFQLGIFTSKGELQIHPADLIAIEWIRSFEPTLYTTLSMNENSLFGADCQNLINTCVANLDDKSLRRIKSVLCQIFPFIEREISSSEKVHKTRLACKNTFLLYVDKIAPSRADAEAQTRKGNALTNAGDESLDGTNLLIAEGQFKNALKAYNEALRRDPEFLDALVSKAYALISLGEMQIELGKFEESRTNLGNAIEACESALLHAPTHVPAMNTMGIIFTLRSTLHARTNDFVGEKIELTSAVENFKSATELDRYFIDLYINKGNALHKLALCAQNLKQNEEAIKYFQEAIASFHEALELAPTHVDALFAKGISHLALGLLSNNTAMLKWAADLFESTIQISPHYIDAHFQKGKALYEFGKYSKLNITEINYSESLKLFEFVTSKDSQNIEALEYAKEIRRARLDGGFKQKL